MQRVAYSGHLPKSSWGISRARRPPAAALDLLIVLAHFRTLGEPAIDVGEDGAHVGFRRWALHHDHQFGLVRRGADQSPGAVLQHHAHTVYGDEIADLLPGDGATVGGGLLVLGGDLVDDGVFYLVGAVRRHGG